MSARRSERLLNLLIMLLVQRRYVPKERIREVLYPDARGDAFDRMFDRDKEELRSLGVPIEVGSLSVFHDDEVGYRIRPDDLALPEISLTAEEASVLTLAGKVWHHAHLADTTAAALRKLMPALPADEQPPAPAVVEPVIDAEEPSFEDFWTAIQERREVTFDYRKPGDPTPIQRRLQPWGMVRQSGRWYVVGRDVTHDEERIFRLSRVLGTCRVGRTPEAFTVPADVDLRDVATRLRPQPEETTAHVLVRRGAGHALRRRADRVEEQMIGPDGSDTWDRVTLRGGLRPLAEEVLMLGPRAFAESPPELRDTVRGRLHALADRLADGAVG